MKTTFLIVGVLLQYVYGESLVNIRLPFLSSAGVTYINGPTPTGLVAAPVPIHYSQQYRSQFNIAAPLHAAPVHHITAVADVPVTQIEAHHGVIQKLVDVASPATKTRKFEVRRPAIQKQFFDIEERVIVRPAGSALVELDHPTSKNQKGADIITSLQPSHIIPVAGFVPQAVQPVFVSSTPAPVEISSQPNFDNSSPQFGNVPNDDNNGNNNDDDAVVIEARSKLQLQPQFQNNEQNQQQQQQEVEIQQFQRNQSPVFETAFNNHQSILNNQPEKYQQHLQRQEKHPQPSQRQQHQQQQQPKDKLQDQHQFQLEQLQRAQQDQLQQLQERQVHEQQAQEEQRRQFEQQQQQQQQQPDDPQQFENMNFRNSNPQPQVETRSNGAPALQLQTSAVERQSNSPFIYSRQASPAELHTNQQRLIQLLTERNGVTEVGNFESSQQLRSSSNIFDTGVIRARVLSATPAPLNAERTDERVNTRRIVLSRPIETVQEVEVIEPATKIDRIQVNQPTLFKTARLGVQRIHTSIPAVSAIPAHHYTAYHHHH